MKIEELKKKTKFLGVEYEALKILGSHGGALIAVAEALAPFSHDDLCAKLGGNVEGDDSIIFQRNNAIITLGDCRRASAALRDLEAVK